MVSSAVVDKDGQVCGASSSGRPDLEGDVLHSLFLTSRTTSSGSKTRGRPRKTFCWVT